MNWKLQALHSRLKETWPFLFGSKKTDPRIFFHRANKSLHPVDQTSKIYLYHFDHFRGALSQAHAGRALEFGCREDLLGPLCLYSYGLDDQIVVDFHSTARASAINQVIKTLKK